MVSSLWKCGTRTWPLVHSSSADLRKVFRRHSCLICLNNLRRHWGFWRQMWRVHLVLSSWIHEVIDSLEYDLFPHPLPSIQGVFFLLPLCLSALKKNLKSGSSQKGGSRAPLVGGGKFLPGISNELAWAVSQGIFLYCGLLVFCFFFKWDVLLDLKY